MTPLPFTRLVLLAALAALGPFLAAPAWTQAVDAGALSPGSGAPAGDIAGAAPQLADPGGAARAEMKVLMERLSGKGPVSATVPDLSAYGDGTLMDMKAALDPDADPCVASVQAALFLDAHLAETGWWERMKSIDRPAEAAARIALIWALPDAYGVTADGLDILAFRKASPVFKALSIASNAISSHEVLMQHNIGSVEQRQAIWTQDIVQKSVKFGWDEAIISDRRKSLQGKTLEYVGALAKLDQKAEADMKRIEDAYAADIAGVDRWESDQYDRLQLENAGKPILPDSAFTNEQLAGIRNEAVAKGLAARVKRDQALTKVALDYDSTASGLLQDIAKAQTQQDALVRYAHPIARNECASIRKDGPLPKVPLAPSDLDKPYARDDKDAERLVGVLGLPHDQLLATLEALGLWPDDAFLSCVCHAAGYGSSGTAQVYHPGTIGTYDERYSCQHPGDPCVVSGFGCMRYPLPTDPAPWEQCAATARGEAAQSVTDAILSRMAARRSKTRE